MEVERGKDLCAMRGEMQVERGEDLRGEIHFARGDAGRVAGGRGRPARGDKLHRFK